MAITSRDIGRELCDALDLPADRVFSVRLNVVSNEIVTIDVSMSVEADQFSDAIEILKRFELVEKEDGNSAVA